MLTLDEYLDEKKALCDRIRYKEARILFFRSKANACTSRYGEKIGSTPSPNMHMMEDAMVEVMSLEDEIAGIKAELSMLNDSFRETIHRIGDVRLEMVLEMRYIEDGTWEEIAHATGYSRTQLHRYLSQGLNKLDGVDSS